MIIEIIIASVTFLYSIWFLVENLQHPKRPPGPIRIPPFGNLIQLGLQMQESYEGLARLSKKYGEVMSIKMGFVETVIFSSYESAKTVFSRDDCIGRHCNGFVWDRNKERTDIGLIFAENPHWSSTRNFCRNTLRSYGYGNRTAMRRMLLEEMSEFIKFLETDASSSITRCVKFHDEYFHPAFSNIMSTWIKGSRFDYEDPDFKFLLARGNEMIKGGTFGAGLMMAFPIIRKICPKLLGYDLHIAAANAYHNAGVKFLRQRKLTDYSHPSCFTDDFLIQMDLEAGMEPSQQKFSEDHFGLLFNDIILAGTDTTSNVVNFIMMHLVANPSIQEKLYEEIVQVAGPNREPDLDQKTEMPYTQAVIWEGLRWSRVIVLGVPRRATEDITYGKHLIKKGSVLMFNLQSIFFDETVWTDPDRFNPERFFDTEGNLDARKVEMAQISFGTGKRNCFGEVLARDSLFTFVTTLIQKFKFTSPLGKMPVLKPILGFTMYGHPYEAIVTKRK